MSMNGAVLSLSFTRVCKARSRITRAMMQRGSELASLLPTDVRHWWPIIEDIFGSPRVAEIMNRMTSFFTQSREYEYISIDATIKCCVSVLGQESWRANVVVRNPAGAFRWHVRLPESADSSRQNRRGVGHVSCCHREGGGDCHGPGEQLAEPGPTASYVRRRRQCYG